MDHFNYRSGQLYCEDVSVDAIAEKVGTPAYVYSKATLLHHYRQIVDAFAPLAEQGCGFDVTSGGELYRALAAGGDPKKIIYAGVGKTDAEIAEALRVGIAAFNIESEAEARN